MIVKISAQYSDGTTHDFLSLDDFLAMYKTPELHPDASLTGASAPQVAPAATVSSETPTESVLVEEEEQF